MKTATADREGFRFGIATRDITPTRPAWLDGYTARKTPSGKVSEPLSLGCLAIANGRKTVLLVCCDNLGIEYPLCAELFRLLEKQVGITYPDVLLACSHTHFAPTLRHDGFAGAKGYFVAPDPAYLADFRVKLVEAARESLRLMKPGRLETARAPAPQVHYNRRPRRPDGSVTTRFMYPTDAADLDFPPVDSEMTVLRFRDDGGVRAILVNFGCHPVTHWGIRNVSDDVVSADYPHYLRETLQAHYGCPVLFTQGAAGDVVPMDRYGDNRRRIGDLLGHTVVLAERRFQAEKSPALATATATVPARTFTRRDPVRTERAFAELMAAYGPRLLDPAKPAGTQIFGTPAWDPLNPIVANAHQVRLYPDNRFRVSIQFLRIGGTVLVSLPFEVLSEIALTMKAAAPHSVLVSCANGYQGYLPLAHEFKRGGYEVAPAAHFAPDTGDRILKTILQKLKRF